MRLSVEDLRDMIRREIEVVMKDMRKDEANPYHGMKGAPNAGQFTTKDDDGSWAIGKDQYKYRKGKKAVRGTEFQYVVRETNPGR